MHDNLFQLGISAFYKKKSMAFRLVFDSQYVYRTDKKFLLALFKIVN